VVSPPFPKIEALVRLNCVTLFLSKSYQLAAPPLSPASIPRLSATPRCAPHPLLSTIPIDWQESLPLIFGVRTCCLLPPLVVGFQRIGRRTRVRVARCVVNTFVVLGVDIHDAVSFAIRHLYHGSQRI